MVKNAAHAIPNQRLVHERLLHQWSQQEVADRIGTTSKNVSRWERGVTTPGPHFRYQLCLLFEKDSSALGLVRRTGDGRSERSAHGLVEVSEDQSGVPAVSGAALSSQFWNVPYARNSYFTGREDVLEKLHELLSSSSAGVQIALSGLGGIGKTQLALEYAYRFRSEYDTVLWVRAETAELLITDFLALADRLQQRPERIEQDQNYVMKAVKRWLGEHERWLLILDNVEDISLAKDVVPVDHSGHLLLTTRAGSPGTFAECIDVGEMAQDEGALLLLRRSRRIARNVPLEEADPAEQASARCLCSALGGLPLALNQAAAYIDETQCGVEDYVQLFQAHSLRLLRERDVSTYYSLSVARTFVLAFEQVQQKNLVAVELLTACAFLAPDAIPEALVSVGEPPLVSALTTQVSQAIALNTAFKDLRAYSLLRRDSRSKLLAIHRLVQIVIREEMPEGRRQEWLMRVIAALDHAFPILSHIGQLEVDRWPMCDVLLPHALEVLALSMREPLASTQAISLLIKAGSYLSERARYKEAEALLQRATAMQDQIRRPVPPENVALLEALAHLRKRQGRYGEAEALFLRARACWERVQGTQCLQSVGTFIGLADVYRYEGKYQEGEALLLQAVTVLQEVLGSDNPQLAYPLYILAHIYAQQGRYWEAEPLYQQAWMLWQQALDKEHPQLAGPMIGLAELWRQRGKYEEAEHLFQQAYVLLERALGQEHPQVSFPLSNLATLYIQQGRYGEAEALYQRVLAIRRQALGHVHLQVVIPLANLAELYRRQGKDEQAEPLLLQSISILEQLHGPAHPQVAYPVNSLAGLYAKRGRWQDAEQLFQRAVSILECHGAADHPEVASALEGLALLYAQAGRCEQAQSFLLRALHIHEQSLGMEHPTTLRVRERCMSILDEEILKEQ